MRILLQFAKNGSGNKKGEPKLALEFLFIF